MCIAFGLKFAEKSALFVALFFVFFLRGRGVVDFSMER